MRVLPLCIHVESNACYMIACIIYMYSCTLAIIYLRAYCEQCYICLVFTVCVVLKCISLSDSAISIAVYSTSLFILFRGCSLPLLGYTFGCFYYFICYMCICECFVHECMCAVWISLQWSHSVNSCQSWNPQKFYTLVPLAMHTYIIQYKEEEGRQRRRRRRRRRTCYIKAVVQWTQTWVHSTAFSIIRPLSNMTIQLCTEHNYYCISNNIIPNNKEHCHDMRLQLIKTCSKKISWKSESCRDGSSKQSAQQP